MRILSSSISTTQDTEANLEEPSGSEPPRTLKAKDKVDLRILYEHKVIKHKSTGEMKNLDPNSFY